VKVMDLTGRATELPSVQALESAELLISLCAFGLPDDWPTLELEPGLFERIRAAAPRRLIEAFERIGPAAGKVWANLVGVAVRAPAADSAPSFLQRVEAMSSLDVRLTLLGQHVPAYQRSLPAGVLARAAGGDGEAVGRLLTDGLYFGGRADPILRSLLALGADETKAAALEVLRGWWTDVFPHHFAPALPALRRDARQKRALAATTAPDRLIEMAGGIEYAPDPTIRRVHLIPQHAMRPWVLLCEYDEDRLFCYPTSDESLSDEPADPPARLVRIHRALGDRKRLRMLSALASREATLQELADRFGLPKSTAHHHLAILRAAGLISVSAGYDRRYRLRRDVVPDASRLLETYLSQMTGPSAAAPVTGLAERRVP
jgi:DNA-binding transcriptional ArsR family regulator